MFFLKDILSHLQAGFSLQVVLHIGTTWNDPTIGPKPGSQVKTLSMSRWVNPSCCSWDFQRIELGNLQHVGLTGKKNSPRKLNWINFCFLDFGWSLSASTGCFGYDSWSGGSQTQPVDLKAVPTLGAHRCSVVLFKSTVSVNVFIHIYTYLYYILYYYKYTVYINHHTSSWYRNWYNHIRNQNLWTCNVLLMSCLAQNESTVGTPSNHPEDRLPTCPTTLDQLLVIVPNRLLVLVLQADFAAAVDRNGWEWGDWLTSPRFQATSKKLPGKFHDFWASICFEGSDSCSQFWKHERFLPGIMFGLGAPFQWLLTIHPAGVCDAVLLGIVMAQLYRKTQAPGDRSVHLITQHDTMITYDICLSQNKMDRCKHTNYWNLASALTTSHFCNSGGYWKESTANPGEFGRFLASPSETVGAATKAMMSLSRFQEWPSSISMRHFTKTKWFCQLSRAPPCRHSHVMVKDQKLWREIQLQYAKLREDEVGADLFAPGWEKLIAVEPWESRFLKNLVQDSTTIVLLLLLFCLL